MIMAVTASFLGPFNHKEVCNMCCMLPEYHSYDIIILMYGQYASSFHVICL